MENLKKQRKIPIGIIILTIIFFIYTLGFIALSITSFIKPELFQNIPGFVVNIENKSLFLGFAIFLIILSIFTLFIAIGLLKSWKFSRILAITISLIFIIGQAISIRGFNLTDIIGILNLVFNLAIILYFILSKKSKEYFKKTY